MKPYQKINLKRWDSTPQQTPKNSYIQNVPLIDSIEISREEASQKIKHIEKKIIDQITQDPLGNKFKNLGSYSFSPKKIRQCQKLHSYKKQEELKGSVSTLSSLGSFQHVFKLNKTQTSQFPENSFRISDFEQIKLLGQGRYGKVYLVRHKKTNFLGAIKQVKKSLFQGKENYDKLTQFIRQLKIQLYCCSQSLIKLYSFFDDSRKVYLLMEFGCHGSLYSLMKTKHKYSEGATSFIIKQLLKGVRYLHQQKIIHRDIKPENIVVCHGVPKLCDFGSSIYIENYDLRSTICGTPLYCSPEILIGEKYGYGVDIWALGFLAFELHTGQNPFNIKVPKDLQRIIKEEIDLRKGSPAFKSFINFSLRKNPRKRPNSETLSMHPFLTDSSEMETSQQLCNSGHCQQMII